MIHSFLVFRVSDGRVLRTLSRYDLYLAIFEFWLNQNQERKQVDQQEPTEEQPVMQQPPQNKEELLDLNRKRIKSFLSHQKDKQRAQKEREITKIKKDS